MNADVLFSVFSGLLKGAPEIYQGNENLSLQFFERYINQVPTKRVGEGQIMPSNSGI